MTTPPPRFLLCRPRGGMNDTLCQIQRCWDYAVRYQRILIIDTTCSGLHGPFSDFFELRRPRSWIELQLTSRRLADLEPLSCQPEAIAHRIGQYRSAIEWSRDHGIVLKGTRTQISFDFNQDHPEAVLVHEQGGGGQGSFDLLEQLRLASSIVAEITGTLERCPRPYVGIHVRNTDYRTDYISLFEDLATELRGQRVLVCSDDAAVIQEARQHFWASELLVTSEPPHSQGEPLHHINTFQDISVSHRLAHEALIDLLALGGSSSLHFRSHRAGESSGFSLLAQHLQRHQDVIKALLHRPPLLPTLSRWRLSHAWRRCRRSVGTLPAVAAWRQRRRSPS